MIERVICCSCLRADADARFWAFRTGDKNGPKKRSGSVRDKRPDAPLASCRITGRSVDGQV